MTTVGRPHVANVSQPFDRPDLGAVAGNPTREGICIVNVAIGVVGKSRAGRGTVYEKREYRIDATAIKRGRAHMTSVTPSSATGAEPEHGKRCVGSIVLYES